MKRTAIIVALAMAGMLMGCQDQEYDVQIRQAHEALVTGFPELADHHLEKAEALADDSRVGSTVDGELLRAELKLQQGHFEAATQLAGQVAAKSSPGSINMARANEILGKVAIRQGKLDAATEYLTRAQKSFMSPADQYRLKDLLNIVNGLSAYSQGRTRLAQKHWDKITNEQLKIDLTTTTSTASKTVILQ